MQDSNKRCADLLGLNFGSNELVLNLVLPAIIIESIRKIADADKDFAISKLIKAKYLII